MNRDSHSTILDPSQHDWLQEKGLRAIFAAFAKIGAEARAVGGAVRNSLIGQPVADVDLAVNLPPEAAEAALQKAGIKVKRTGFAHGTVTAILGRRGYEITSLRRDVEADGRHTAVAYTGVWEEDAARRDFTMNALYADADGRVYDYHDGIGDLRAGRVRFIGDAAARIAEDYLRILRYFRFYAIYGRGAADAAALQACEAAAPAMVLLSRERVTQEWRKLLLAGDPVPALELMRARGILAPILPLELDLPRLAVLLRLEGDAAFALRQAALLPQDALLEPVLQAALRLSNAECRAVVQLCDPARAMPSRQADLPCALYQNGAQYCRARLLLQAAAQPVRNLPELLAIIRDWQAPVFPLQGDDLLKLGLESSPQLGGLLRAVEDWWIADGFGADKAACLAEARRRMQSGHWQQG